MFADAEFPQRLGNSDLGQPVLLKENPRIDAERLERNRRLVANELVVEPAFLDHRADDVGADLRQFDSAVEHTELGITSVALRRQFLKDKAHSGAGSQRRIVGQT